MNDFNLYSVNWQDGMLITQRHLRDQEKYFEELARWYSIRFGDSYGLVKKSYSGKPSLNMSATVSGNRLRVEISRCHALTPGGFYIGISDSSGGILRAEAEITEKQVPVYIAVDISSKKQVGDPDPSEDIPRIPYQISDYSLHLGKAPGFPEEQFVQIAELSIRGSEANPSEGYYPPSVTTNSDEKLAQKSVDFRNRLENLLALASRAHMAVATAGALVEASTSLQLAFKDTMYLMVNHLAATLDDFVVGRNSSHPLFMVNQFKKLFRVLSSLLNLQPGLKDYLNQQFFNKELHSEVGKFIAAVDAFLLSEYNHRDLGGQIKMIDDNLDIFRGMLNFLAQTRPEQLGEQAVATETLTYNGRTYKNVKYGGIKLEQIGELSYLMITVLEPRGVSDSVALITKDIFSDAEWRNMQVRLGVNEARGLGETDPIDVDAFTFGNKVALHPRDMLKSSSVRKFTLIFRGAGDPKKFEGLGKMDLIVYAL